MLAWAAGVFGAVPADAQPTPEYQLKGAILLKFPNFVEPPVTGEVRVCVVGKNPFDDVLERLAAERGEKVTVLSMPDTSAPLPSSSCHIAFINRDLVPRAAALLRRMASNGCITVSDKQGFIDAGGMIELLVRDGHIVFVVNAQAGAEVGIKFSSKMLALAAEVRGE